MAQARKHVLTDDSLLTYHVITRCARREWLIGGDYAYRRAWIVELMNELLSNFAIELLSYAIMSNHVHLVLRQRPDVLAGWSREKLALAGLRGIPVRLDGKNLLLPATKANARRYAEKDEWLAECSERLSSISWFMRLLKQRIARRANKEDNSRGHFWESRFQTVPLLDNGAVLACMAYVDLNPWRAGIGKTIGAALYTSIRQRLLGASLIAPTEKDSEAEGILGKRLLSLAKCRPVDNDSGTFSTAPLKIEHYLNFLSSKSPLAHDSHKARKSQTALQSDSDHFQKLCNSLGIDPHAWTQRRMEPGAFQGTAVGKESSRKRFAAEHNKKTLADKTKIWISEREAQR